MKLSQNFTKTTRETLADETSKNAQLLIRAGYVHKAMPGVYAYLPLGLRMLNKIENIVRKNMNSVGGQEILMNSLHPKEWWLKANRWDNVDILFKLNSQTKNEYALACSHEEQVVPIASSYIQSYKDLPEYNSKDENGAKPLCVYQIQTKFRDEIRAKSGLLRGREFRMKDMYDFHSTKESQDAYYELVKATYYKVYEEMGLKSYATTASGGIFTTNISHEFQVECEAGEDWIYKDKISGEVFNEEMAPCIAPKVDLRSEEKKEKQDHLLEGIVGVDALCRELGIENTRTTKTIFYQNQKGQLVAAVVRGDRNVNEAKLRNVTKQMLTLATEENIMKQTGSKIGYAGVINLDSKVEIFYDTSCEFLHNFETGTNKTGYHTTNVCFSRDIQKPDQFFDISEVQEGDKNPVTNGEYEKLRTAEVGNIFKLDNKYTKAFGTTYLDKDGKPQTPLMNCHGIGTSRCMAIIAELYSDEKGLKLPAQVAPFEIHLVTHINPKDEVETNERIIVIANKIYDGEIKLVKTRSGRSKLLDTTDINQVLEFAKEDSTFSINNLGSDSEILWDDRSGKISIGEKLKDADLIGCPTQIVISKRSLENGGVEIIDRASGDSVMMRI
jgi:prolyl-tRNA synthetase